MLPVSFLHEQPDSILIRGANDVFIAALKATGRFKCLLVICML